MALDRNRRAGSRSRRVLRRDQRGFEVRRGRVPDSHSQRHTRSNQVNVPEVIMRAVNLDETLDRFSEHWSPKIVGELNGQLVKLVKFKGEFVWHHHDVEDEMFLVVRGYFDMHLRDGVVRIREGEFYIVPRGVEHKPVAEEEAHVLLFEPATTLNTGNVRNERTRETLER